MSLLNRLFHRRRPAEPIHTIVPSSRPLQRFLSAETRGRLVRKKVNIRDFQHHCGIELLEDRQLLSADGMTVTMASVYLEGGLESVGDMFSVCWVGDERTEDSTQMTKMTINLGKDGYFDTTQDPPGSGERYGTSQGVLEPFLPFTLVTEDTRGTGQVSTISLNDFIYYFDGDPNNTVGNGASSLTIVFNDGVMTQGEKLVFLIDVDHTETLDANKDTAYFEDYDIANSKGYITAWFTSDHYIINDAEYDLAGEETSPFLYQEKYDLKGIPLLSNEGRELGEEQGRIITGESIHTAGVVTDIPLDLKPTISGYVYADVVKNCYFVDPEDYAIENVSVSLQRYDAEQNIYTTIATTYTNAEGYYEFDGLLAGDYRVVSESGIKYVEKGVTYVYTDSCARSQDNPVSPNPLILETTVSIGHDSINNNFGKVLCGSIEGNVYEDRNDNGLKEVGEPGIEDVTVGLFYLNGEGEYVAYTENGVQVTTKTDADGHYRFDNLKVYDNQNKTLYMTYAVKEVHPEEYDDGKDTPGTINGVTVGKVEEDDFITEIFLGWNQHGIDYNFGELLLGSIEGNVFEDRNDNGHLDIGEPGIENVTVELLKWDGTQYKVVDSMQTDANGHYFFDKLQINGDYAVREIQPTQYDDGKDELGTFNGVERGVQENKNEFRRINVGWDEHGINYNFGELLLGSISGYVFEDHNDNGIYEKPEAGGPDQPIEGVSITLYRLVDGNYEAVYDAQGKLRTTVTDANGYYSFDKLDIEQVYAVRETQPEDYTNGKNQLGTFDGIERGIKGYDEFRDVDVHWDEHGVEYNFGELKLGSIAGYVFEDHNDNGIYEKPEAGGPDQPIEGVKVTLYKKVGNDYVAVLDEMGNIRTEYTDQFGFYRFDNLDIEQVYAVRETQPEDYVNGKNQLGTFNGVERGVKGLDEFKNVDVHWDEHGIEYNFGELKLGSLSGHVFEDHNNNGIYEKPEAGGPDKPIAGITVTLYKLVNGSYQVVRDAQGNPRATITDATGYYQFDDLDIEQVYAIRETQPEEYDDGKDQLGTINGVERGEVRKNEFFSIKVAWDEHGVEYNFGELLLGSLSGHVFEDRNDNGIYEKPEAGGPDRPIEGVTVTLYQLINGSYQVVRDAQGNPRTDITDAEGFYEFKGLDIAQTYAIRETQPEEYDNGKNQLGTFNGIERGRVKVDEFDSIDVGWDEHGVEYNFGELKLGSLSGYAYYDVNENGIFDQGDVGLSNVTITLGVLENGSYKSQSSIQTDANGFYKFTKLSINKVYSLTETQPDGYISFRDNVGTIDGIVVGTWAATNYLNDITVLWDNHGINYNFGEIKKETNPPGHNIPPNPPLNYIVRQYHTYQTPMSYIPSNVPTAPITVTRYGGGGVTPSYAWHLSVLNGGYPRSIDALNSVAGFRNTLNRSQYVHVAWEGATTDSGEWLIRGANGEVANRYEFGTPGAIAVVGDWDGDGADNIGLFVNGKWVLDRNSNGTWDNDDLYAELGSNKDQPVSGDWDGDGKSDIGIFGPRWSGDSLAVDTEPGLPADKNPNTFLNVSRPKNVPPEYTASNTNVRVLKHRSIDEVRIDLIDHVFEYGQDGDKAITGDWNGDGIDKIGVYRDGNWFIDVNGNGVFDTGDVTIEGFGNHDSVPIVGDWDGDGIDNIGLFGDGLWALDTNGDYRPDQHFNFGQVGDQPISGDFDGNGTDEVGVYHDKNVASQSGDDENLSI